jgi:hypothetical protein
MGGIRDWQGLGEVRALESRNKIHVGIRTDSSDDLREVRKFVSMTVYDRFIDSNQPMTVDMDYEEIHDLLDLLTEAVTRTENDLGISQRRLR